MKVYCPYCRKEVEYKIEKRDIKEFRKIEVNTYENVAVCKECHKDLYVNEIADPKLVHGRMPKNYNEIIINKNADNSSNYKIGDKIVFKDYLFDLNQKNKEFTVVGIVDSPLYSTMHPERAMVEGEPKYLDSIFYVSLDTVPSIITDKLPKTDIYVTMKKKI